MGANGSRKSYTGKSVRSTFCLCISDSSPIGSRSMIQEGCRGRSPLPGARGCPPNLSLLLLPPKEASKEVQGTKSLAGGAGVSPESFSLLLLPPKEASYEWMSGGIYICPHTQNCAQLP